MKPWKIIVIVVLAFGAFGGSIVWFVLGLTAGVADAGTGFMRTLATDGPHAAYTAASPALRAGTTEVALASLALRLHLSEFASASWSSRSISGSTGTLSGTVTLNSGTTLPVEMTLVKDGDVWKVTSMTVPGGLPVGGGGNGTKN